jgi:DNA/RNA-binding domain of Phe-tRNA-synthetase-like protein
MEVSAVLVATDGWRSTFPGAVVGALVMRGIHNPEHNVALEAAKRRLEQDLRAGADGPDADRIPRAYRDYYRARGSTYHVKAQRESVARKGRPIPRRAALVEAMFMAELKNLILTAGHDLDAVTPPVRVDVTTGKDRYVQLNGVQAVLKRGDMMMVDGHRRHLQRAPRTRPPNPDHRAHPQG